MRHSQSRHEMRSIGESRTFCVCANPRIGIGIGIAQTALTILPRDAVPEDCNEVAHLLENMATEKTPRAMKQLIKINMSRSSRVVRLVYAVERVSAQQRHPQIPAPAPAVLAVNVEVGACTACPA